MPLPHSTSPFFSLCPIWMAPQKKLHSIWGRHGFCTYFTDTAHCIYSGALPSKEYKGRFNTVLDMSADIGTSDSLIRILLCSSECSLPEQREGGQQAGSKHCTDFGAVQKPSILNTVAVPLCWSNTGLIKGRTSLTEALGKIWPAFSF